MLKIYAADITPLYDPVCFESKLRLLHADRRETIFKYRRKEDRCRSVAAGLLLREALLREGISYEHAVFIKGAKGKPCLSDAAVSFNLSHAGERAVCAVSDRGIGVDVESLSRFAGQRHKAQRIANKILNEQEYHAWEQNCSEEELVRIWTKKESCSKLTGEGLSADFSRIDTVHGAFYQERELPGGYYVSVCTQQRMEPASWVMVEL